MKSDLNRARPRRRVIAAILSATALLSAFGPVHAEPQANVSFAGTWTLVAADRQLPDGTRSHDYGDNPQGLMMIDDHGRYSIQIFRGDRARFAAGDRAKGTPEEYKTALISMSTNYGDIAVDWANHTLRVSVVQSSDPNRSGQVETRPFTFDGDILSYHVPPRPDGTIPISVWRRVR